MVLVVFVVLVVQQPRTWLLPMVLVVFLLGVVVVFGEVVWVDGVVVLTVVLVLQQQGKVHHRRVFCPR